MSIHFSNYTRWVVLRLPLDLYGVPWIMGRFKLKRRADAVAAELTLRSIEGYDYKVYPVAWEVRGS